MRMLWIGLIFVVTAAWIAAFVLFTFYFGLSNEGHATHYWHLPELDLNEWGDLLAGTFSPLAFLWFVFAVFLQIAEIRENRIETQLSRRAAEQQSTTSSRILETENRNQQIKISEMIIAFQNRHADVTIGLGRTRTIHEKLLNARRNLWASAGLLKSGAMERFETDWNIFNEILISANEKLTAIEVNDVKTLEQLDFANEQVNQVRAQSEAVKAAVEVWQEADQQLRENRRSSN